VPAVTDDEDFDGPVVAVPIINNVYVLFPSKIDY
jgi:hypothetical protein